MVSLLDAPTGDALLMSMADIAELAGVRRPVVTTWRRRHPHFPAPVHNHGSRPLFAAREVCEWLIDTGRARRNEIEPDLCLYALSTFGSSLPPRELVAAVTALVCLHHLDGAPLAEAGLPELQERAAEVDPDDELLRSDITQLPADLGQLPALVEELIEAAWGCHGAVERIVGAHGRLGARDLAASAVDPELARLMAGLSGVAERAGRSGSLVLADPAAGAGDLLTAVIGTLPESCAPVVLAVETDPYLARLLRRRLTVREVPGEDQHVHIGARLAPSADTWEIPDAVITQLPYRPAESRDPLEVLVNIREITELLAPERVAVVLGPADVLASALPRYSSAERDRAELLASGLVEAVIRLPGGVVPFRPGYETALWVVTSAQAPPLRGRVLLGDVSDRPLTSDVVDAVTTDVVTWRRDGHRADARTRAFCVPAQVGPLINAAGALFAPRLPSVRERSTEVPATVARIAELEHTLSQLADPAATTRPPVRTGLVQAVPSKPKWASIGALLASGVLTLIQGARLDAHDIGAEGNHRVLGAREITGRAPVGQRWIDRATLAQHYPRAALTEPGDVLVTMTPEPAVLIDEEGFAAVEFPARALRITTAQRDQLTPRVLAALLTVSGVRRSDRAVRTSRRLVDVEIPMLDPPIVRRADRMLAEVAHRRALARQELDALDELDRLAVLGLGNGTLTLQR